MTKKIKICVKCGEDWKNRNKRSCYYGRHKSGMWSGKTYKIKL